MLSRLDLKWESVILIIQRNVPRCIYIRETVDKMYKADSRKDTEGVKIFVDECDELAI